MKGHNQQVIGYLRLKRWNVMKDEVGRRPDKYICALMNAFRKWLWLFSCFSSLTALMGRGSWSRARNATRPWWGWRRVRRARVSPTWNLAAISASTSSKAVWPITPIWAPNGTTMSVRQLSQSIFIFSLGIPQDLFLFLSPLLHWQPEFFFYLKEIVEWWNLFSN